MEFGLICRNTLEQAGYHWESTRLCDKTATLRMKKDGHIVIVRCYHYDIVNQIDYDTTTIAITGGTFTGMVHIFAEGSNILLIDGRQLCALTKGARPQDICNAHQYTLREVYTGYPFSDDSYHQYRSRVRDLNNDYSPHRCEEMLRIHWNHMTNAHGVSLPIGARNAIRQDAGKHCAKAIQQEPERAAFYLLYDMQFDLMTGSYQRPKEILTELLSHYEESCEDFLRCQLHNLLQIAMIRGDYPFVLFLKNKLSGISFSQAYDRLLYLYDGSGNFTGYPIRNRSNGIQLYLPDGSPSILLPHRP